jgi:N-acetylmuramoyl-L-alanine amidase CwlA
MSKLRVTERNSIIEDYRQGIVNPSFEVIPSKRTKGKYTVRPRTRQLSEAEITTISGKNKTPETAPSEPVIPSKSLKHEINSKLYSNISELQNQLNAQMMMKLNDLNSKMERIKEKKRQKKLAKNLEQESLEDEAPPAK